MKEISESLFKKVATKARKSPRRRQNYNFHQYKDKVQRIINVMEPDTYVQPHKHENPDKVEVFIALKGSGLALTFNNRGRVKSHTLISSNGPIFGVEIPPRVWHVLISLSRDAAFYEIIEGPYDGKSHKKFATWAPDNDKEGRQYYKKIRKKLNI